MKHQKYLSKIKFPKDLKKLKREDLPGLCEELRDFIVKNAAENGGHFGSSLGVVELTVALHYVFNAPDDKIVWDVGHQAYGHKILTGRRNVFHTNRKKGGICGFIKPSESEYDAFISGHASVSISAALGMAMASKLKGEKRSHIAVIGDGAMTGGIAFEALNNAGAADADLLVILNDNQMSIDPNVGAFTKLLVDLSASKSFNLVRNRIKETLKSAGKFGGRINFLAERIEKSLKNILFRNSNFFESMGFRYFGPVDGHEVKNLARILTDLKKISGPKVLHILTTKGKGFLPAEQDQTKWHATAGFDKDFPEKVKMVSKGASVLKKYQDVFGETLCELAQKNEKIVGVTPAMISGAGMNKFFEQFPCRAFDVGIAEQHAVTFSAGMATQGFLPFCHIYSTFAQRAYDQIIHDVAIEKLPVIFCLDRAGLVGEDGETHHGSFDLAFLRTIPNLVIAAPMDEVELRNLMFTASEFLDGPFVIRYPRGNVVGLETPKSFEKLEMGKGRCLSEGKELAILSIGHVGNFVRLALESIEKDVICPAHYDARFVKPLDEVLLSEIFKRFKKIITVEDGSLAGGFGSAVLEFAATKNYTGKIVRLGIPDKFIPHASVLEQQAECGFCAVGILRAIKDLV